MSGTEVPESQPLVFEDSLGVRIRCKVNHNIPSEQTKCCIFSKMQFEKDVSGGTEMHLWQQQRRRLGAGGAYDVVECGGVWT